VFDQHAEGREGTRSPSLHRAVPFPPPAMIATLVFSWSDGKVGFKKYKLIFGSVRGVGSVRVHPLHRDADGAVPCDMRRNATQRRRRRRLVMMGLLVCFRHPAVAMLAGQGHLRHQRDSEAPGQLAPPDYHSMRLAAAGRGAATMLRDWRTRRAPGRLPAGPECQLQPPSGLLVARPEGPLPVAGRKQPASHRGACQRPGQPSADHDACPSS
jgi:hypothetical protein